MDAVSVVVRQSLVQTRTPSDMLGRVIAVNAGQPALTSECRPRRRPGLHRPPPRACAPSR
jgi:hypothetical protein